MMKLAQEDMGVGDGDMGIAGMVRCGSQEFHDSRDFGHHLASPEHIAGTTC